MTETRRDLTRTTLGVLFIGALIVTSLWIVKPFLAALVWATMIVVATWPAMLAVQARLRGKRSLAVLVMTVGLLLVLVVPLTLAIVAVVDNSDRIVHWVRSLSDFHVPPPPDWVSSIPLVGAKLRAFWDQYAADGVQDLAARLTPYAGDASRWLAGKAGNIGMLVLQFLLTVIIAGILYAGGDSAAAWLRRFGHRLGGPRSEHAVVLAGQAIRGVALGVVVTALVQSLLGGIGLAIAGLPMAVVLTALMFMLCIAQIGPGLVLIPAVVWLYWTGDNAWATFLLVWSLVVVSLDNFLRPYLIKKGADLPLLLIFAGVIGGLIAFGLVGIFVGPVVLAVAYTLLDAWVDGEAEPR